MPASQNDINNWNAFKSGNRAAFEELFRSYHPTLIQYGSKICADRELLEDAIQDLFIEIWQSPSGSPVISVKAYLLKALKYKLFRMLKSETQHRSTDDISEQMVFSFSHDHFLVSREEEALQAEKVRKAVERLPPRQREIVYLRIYQGLEYAEISEIMSINYQVARNLFYQSMKSLRSEYFGF